MDLTTYKNKKNIIDIKKEGENIYKNNEFFRDLHNMMQNKEFKDFYDKYFSNWTDCKVIVLYMKLYETIGHEYRTRFKKEIPEEFRLFIIREMMRRNDIRKLTMKSFQDYTDSEKLSNDKYLNIPFSKNNLRNK